MPERAEEMREHTGEKIKRRKLPESELKIIHVLSRFVVQVRGRRAPLLDNDRRNRGPKESGSGRSDASSEQSSDKRQCFAWRPNLCQVGTRRSVHYCPLRRYVALLPDCRAITYCYRRLYPRPSERERSVPALDSTGVPQCLAQENICVFVLLVLTGLAGADGY